MSHESEVNANPPGSLLTHSPRPAWQPLLTWNQETRRQLRRPDVQPTLLGLVLAVGICYPFFRSGYLFLLDWVIGPHTAVVSSQSLGLFGGLTTSTPALAIEAFVAHVVHGPATWLPLFLFFPLSAFSISRLVGGTVWCRLGAATLYAVNPFVFNRIYVGHIPLLIGYALLPLATKSALNAHTARGVRLLAPAVWWAVLTALSVHYCWIFGVIMLAVACCSRRSAGRTALWLFLNTAVYGLSCAYLLLPHFGTALPLNIGGGSLAAFRTTSDPRLGLLVNVLGLYGFWRTGPGPVLPKTLFAGWPFLLLAILLIAAAGASSSIRRRDRDESDVNGERFLTIVLLVSGALGVLLAMGDQGPTGAVFRWAYYHVPFFNIMREPQKFSMLIALALAVLFGRGISRLMASAGNLKRSSYLAVGALLSVAIPLAYTPTIFSGLDGQIAVSTIPSSWSQANEAMGNGPGKILDLPWHLYQSFPFAGNRVIANPAESSFSRDVISGDNLQVAAFQSNSTSARSTYLQTLFAHGGKIRNFGSLVAPLGVRYVLLSKTVDWSNYSWLTRQRDLKRILDTKDLEVWVNLSYQGVGARYDTVASVRTVGQLETKVARAPGDLAPYVLSRSAKKSGSTPTREGSVSQVSPVSYHVGSGQPGWVAVDALYEPGWSDGTGDVRASAEGTVLVRVGSGSSTITFSPWRLVQIGYVVSALVIGILLFAFIRSSKPRRRRHRHSSKDEMP